MPYRSNPPDVPVELVFSEDELFLVLAAAELQDLDLDTYIRRCTSALAEAYVPASAIPALGLCLSLAQSA